MRFGFRIKLQKDWFECGVNKDGHGERMIQHLAIDLEMHWLQDLVGDYEKGKGNT